MTAIAYTDRLKGSSLILVSGVCWGFHGVLIKFAYELGASFQQVFFVEALIATLFFSCFFRSFTHPLRPTTRRHWIELSISGIATLGLGTFLFLSFSLGPVAIGATLLFLYLPQVYGYSVLIDKQPFTLFKAIAIALLLVGAALATNILDVGKASLMLPALLSGIVASTCYATIFILTPRMSTYTSATFRSFFLSASGMLGSGFILLLVPDTRYDISSNWLAIAGLFFVLGTVGQILPVITLMNGIPLIGISLAGVLASTELPIAVLSSAFILGEPITLEIGIGVALVFVGIILFNSNTD